MGNLYTRSVRLRLIILRILIITSEKDDFTMTKNTNTPHLLVNNPTMSISSTSSTFLVKDLKIENTKLDTKSSKEGKSPVVPNIVVLTNNKNDIEEGWTDITKSNRKAKSSGNVTGAIVTGINDQQLTVTGHGNFSSSTNPTT